MNGDDGKLRFGHVKFAKLEGARHIRLPVRRVKETRGAGAQYYHPSGQFTKLNR